MSLGGFQGKRNAIFILSVCKIDVNTNNQKRITHNFSKDLINYLSIWYNEQRHPYRIKNVDDDEDEDAMASGPLDVQINAIMMIVLDVRQVVRISSTSLDVSRKSLLTLANA